MPPGYAKPRAGGQHGNTLSPAIIGTRDYAGTIRSTFKERPSRSGRMAWAGAGAAAHVIDAIEGESLVKTRNLELHFAWNLGYIAGTARSGRKIWTHGNKSRYAYVVPATTEIEFVLEKSSFRELALEFNQPFLLSACELEHLPFVEIQEIWEYADPLCWALAAVIYKECMDEVSRDLLYSETAMTMLAYHLVKTVSMHGRSLNVFKRGGLAPTLLRRACDYMMARLGEGVSLQEIAAVTGLSVGHFAFAFKRSLGIAPHMWLRRQRIEWAKTLLSDPALNLTGIAFVVGYANQSAFGVAFKRETGLTPTEWRRRC
ncbi:MAG TPA: AraC family transcriptional regulator [Aliidongia sp.]|nr:AraC family transcriptional regulator [Aliidongia sp.]